MVLSGEKNLGGIGYRTIPEGVCSVAIGDLPIKIECLLKMLSKEE